jgi:cyclophilin family peptidyl-prolyl cis-trans isomerase
LIITYQVGKKGYVQLQTSHGNLNFELHCDIAMRVCWNFITLCERGYYDGVPFHRLVPGFMLQGGDPSGSGSGGHSAWGKGKPFRDTFDARILHDSRGVLSMANSGLHSNGSQFFVTLKAASHLDYKHSVFGRLVGGAAVLDRIEGVGADKKEKPLQEVMILKATVFTNPVEEADKLLLAEIEGNIKRRLSNVTKTAVPLLSRGEGQPKLLTSISSSSSSSSSSVSEDPSSGSSSCLHFVAPVDAPIVGKYLAQARAEPIASKKMSIDFANSADGESSLKKQKKATGYDDFSGW